MEYRKINENAVEILPGNTPILDVLLAVARASYELAVPVGRGFLQPYSTPVNEIDFSKMLDVTGLYMDYVCGRQCKTRVGIDEKGRLIFNASLFKKDRGPVEPMLDIAKKNLEQRVKE